MTEWTAILLLVALYCGFQVVRDFRAKSYPMAILGCVCLTLLLFTPIAVEACIYEVTTSR